MAEMTQAHAVAHDVGCAAIWTYCTGHCLTAHLVIFFDMLYMRLAVLEEFATLCRGYTDSMYNALAEAYLPTSHGECYSRCSHCGRWNCRPQYCLQFGKSWCVQVLLTPHSAPR